MERNSFFCCGFTYQGQTFPLPADTWIGYWYNNTFVRADECDLVLYRTVPVVMWTDAGLQQQPFGTYPLFVLRGQYYDTLTEAQYAKEYYEELDNNSGTVSQIYTFDPCTGLKKPSAPAGSITAKIQRPTS